MSFQGVDGEVACVWCSFPHARSQCSVHLSLLPLAASQDGLHHPDSGLDGEKKGNGARR